jgi:hypothetical protein
MICSECGKTLTNEEDSQGHDCEDLQQGEYKVIVEFDICGFNEDDIKEQIEDLLQDDSFKLNSIKENKQYRKDRTKINQLTKAILKGGLLK